MTDRVTVIKPSRPQPLHTDRSLGDVGFRLIRVIHAQQCKSPLQ